jgi:hypothetical protein
MADSFDPYYTWLGIPPEEQPAHHYRLLGVRIYESNPSVIENAADQRMTYLRTFQTGKHSTLSQKLLNEVAAARVCLSSAKTKQAYDKELKDRLDPPMPPSAASPVAPPTAPPPVAPPMMAAMPQAYDPQAYQQPIYQQPYQSPVYQQAGYAAYTPEAYGQAAYQPPAPEQPPFIAPIIRELPEEPAKFGLWAIMATCCAALILGVVGVIVFSKSKQPAESSDGVANGKIERESASGGSSKPGDTTTEPTSHRLVLKWPVGERNGAVVEVDGSATAQGGNFETIASDDQQVELRLSPGDHDVQIHRSGYAAFWIDVNDASDDPLVVTPHWLVARPGGRGLLSEFFDGENLESRVRAVVDRQVNGFYGFSSPDPAVPSERFSVRWTGWLKPPAAGQYRLRTIHNDGCRVWIDDKLVIESWQGGENKADVKLEEKPHAFRVEYCDRSGWGIMKLLWTRPDSPIEQVVPGEYFFCDRSIAERAKVQRLPPAVPTGSETSGLTAELFKGDNFNELVKTRIDSVVDRFWADGPPDNSLPADHFSIRWTGQLKPPRSGNYRLAVVASDGCRLRVDGQTVVDSWREQLPTRHEAVVSLTTATVPIELDYYDATSIAAISLRWTPPGEAVEEVIPTEALLPQPAAPPNLRSN